MKLVLIQITIQNQAWMQFLTCFRARNTLPGKEIMSAKRWKKKDEKRG